MQFIIICLCFISSSLFGQTKIHAHNDYQKPEPLFNALNNKADFIEADVWLVKGELLVAHEADEIRNAASLDSLYLQPIIRLFKKYQGKINADSVYIPSLVIDIKKDGPAVLQLLEKKLAAYPDVFDRSVNRFAIQVVISGERGKIGDWKNYPGFIQFDGRPYEEYDSITLAKVAVISDSYQRYVKTNPSITADTVQAVVQKIHALHKPLRLWAIPYDNPDGWQQLIKLGVDILNTDNVNACRQFLSQRKPD